VQPQDELVLRIRQYVTANVPAEQAEVVTHTVCLVVAMLMAEPEFTNELALVRQLREENQWLKTQYTILKQMMDKVGSVKPRKRAPVKKKAPAAPRVKGGTAAQRQAFREGFQGRT
jgi:hypothetical protein